MLSVLGAATVGVAAGAGDSPSFASVAQLAASGAQQASEQATAALTAMQSTGGKLMAELVQRHQQHQLQSGQLTEAKESREVEDAQEAIAEDDVAFAHALILWYNSVPASMLEHLSPLQLWRSPSAEFRPSFSGRSMLLSESPPSFVPRGVLVLLVGLQGLAVLAWMVAVRMRRTHTQHPPPPPCPSLVTVSLPLSLGSRSSSSLSSSLLWWSVINVLFHTVHYADNIWSPAKYCEPEWLYRAYIVTEMEITFAFFTPLMATAVAVAHVVHSFPHPLQLQPLSESKATQLHARSQRLLWLSVLYLSMSLLSGLHYIVEPPASYSWQANVTITGSCMAAAALLFHAVRLHRQVGLAAKGGQTQTQIHNSQTRQVGRGAAYASLQQSHPQQPHTEHAEIDVASAPARDK